MSGEVRIHLTVDWGRQRSRFAFPFAKGGEVPPCPANLVRRVDADGVPYPEPACGGNCSPQRAVELRIPRPAPTAHHVAVSPI